MPSVGSIPISSLKPVSSGTRLWRSGGMLRVTVVVKATFGMMHEGAARLIAPQPLVVEDRYAAGTGSIAEPSDLAPFLPSAGVMVAGHAYAPRPAPAVTVRLAVYRERPLLDKVLHVFGDRPAGAAGPTPFHSIPIAYERAFGGPASADNPVGVGAGPDTRTQPNIVCPSDARRPGGFGPLSSRWGARRRLLAGRPAPSAEPGLELAEGFDFRWFHAAPADQQCDYLQGDEWIVLDGMHPTLPRLQTQLPGIRAEAVWVAPGARRPEGHRLPLLADTLLIDADHQLCAVVWRAHFTVVRAELVSQLRIFTGVEMAGYPIAWPDEAHLEPETFPGSETMPDPDYAPTEKIVINKVRAAALPFKKAAPGDPGPRFEAPRVVDPSGERPELNTTIAAPLTSPFAAGAALPFKKGAPSALPVPAPMPARHDFNDTDTAQTSPFASALPFVGAQPTAAPRASAWASDDTEDRTRMIDPAMIAAGSRQVPFAIAAPSADPPPASTPLPGAPWSAAADPAIAIADPGSETIVARVGDRRLPPIPSAPPRVAPLPQVVAPPMVAPLPQVVAPPMVAPLPQVVAPPMVAPLPQVSAPPMVAPLPQVVAPPMVAPPPMVAAPPMVAPPPQVVAPPMVAPPVAAPAPPMASAEPSPPAETGLRATVLARVKAREAMRDLALAGADLSDLDLSGARLDGLDLRGAKLMRCRLVDARLGEAQLADADLSEADLGGADLSRADLSRAALGLARFDGALLGEANLTGAHGHGASFAGARAARARFTTGEWDGASFEAADLTGADLSGSSLADARCRSATLVDARLNDARGRGAIFDEARLANASLNGAALAAASFRGAHAPTSVWEDATLDEACFAGAELVEANLSRASCARADLRGADLSSANLSRLAGDGATLDEARLAKADLRQARLREASFASAAAKGLVGGKADLTGSRFTRADLEGALLRAARLGGVSFAHANLEGADLRDADLDRTNVFGASRRTAKIGARGVVEIDPDGPEGS